MSTLGELTHATMRANSIINKYSPPSTRSSELKGNQHREVTENHERRMVMEIVDRIFDEKTGIYSVSSSTCSTPQKPLSTHDYDRRLKYWKDMLEERKRIALRIQECLGKPVEQMLFNQRSTSEHEKNMVKRVLDYSDRMNPQALLTKRLLKLREYCQLSTCRNINELRETLPRSEREGNMAVEISGMPEIAKKEQFGHVSLCKRSPWLESEVLEKRIEEKREDIERVVEFYPDIENLQVIGESMLKATAIKRNYDIELLKDEVLMSVSSETTGGTEECKLEVKIVKEEPPVLYGIKVNEHVYYMGMKRSAQHVEIEVRFECFPYEKVIKRVLHLENIGQKILNIELVQRNYYAKVQQLLRCNDNEFVIDNTPFRLIAGETRDIIVQYQPRKVDVVKQQWLLKVDPQFFCRKSDAIILKLSGRCKPPIEYAEKINGALKYVIEKSNMKMIRKLGNNLGSLTPLIKPDEVICPYRRSLDDREIFEQLNLGYTCERYHDIELLKDIHRRVKKPREPAWDLRLESLSELIMRIESPDRRALIFNEMIGVLENMKGIPVELETRVEANPERERSRFLFVRGVICAGIEEWEEMAATIEDAFVNQAVKIHQLNKRQNGSGDTDTSEERTLPHLLPFDADEETVREYMIKKVRRQKPFRDSLFVQTYTHLCNFIEDIVSVIESTEII